MTYRLMMYLTSAMIATTTSAVTNTIGNTTNTDMPNIFIVHPFLV